MLQSIFYIMILFGLLKVIWTYRVKKLYIFKLYSFNILPLVTALLNLKVLLVRFYLYLKPHSIKLLSNRSLYYILKK